MSSIDRMQKAILEEKLGGWLFCNFSHRDSLTDTLLSLDPNAISSRRWFYIIPASGIPVKIVHAIEKSILSSLPGDDLCYSTREGLVSCISRFSGLRMAVLSDPFIQVLSTMDAASWNLIRACGIDTVSAAPLVQRIKGILDEKGRASHEKAAHALYGIVHDSWRLVQDAFRNGTPVSEGDIQDFMLSRFEEEGMITDHPPIVACGHNAGDPHYTVPGLPRTETGRGAILEKDRVVQFDLWGKPADGIYADISWIGFCGKAVPPEIQRRFTIVIAARDLVKKAIESSIGRGEQITGSELDALVRTFLLENCPSDSVRHRTGHGIDTDCHGSGVNLDSVEFPDNRYLMEGSCFSVEPGIYFTDSGFRTEIDIYIQNGKPVISGGEIQKSLLLLED